MARLPGVFGKGEAEGPDRSAELSFRVSTFFDRLAGVNVLDGPLLSVSLADEVACLSVTSSPATAGEETEFLVVLLDCELVDSSFCVGLGETSSKLETLVFVDFLDGLSRPADFESASLFSINAGSISVSLKADLVLLLLELSTATILGEGSLTETD